MTDEAESKKKEIVAYASVRRRSDGMRGVVAGTIRHEEDVKLVRYILHVAWTDGTWSNEKEEDVEEIDLPPVKGLFDDDK